MLLEKLGYICNIIKKNSNKNNTSNKIVLTTFNSWMIEFSNKFFEISHKPLGIGFHFLSHDITTIANEGIL